MTKLVLALALCMLPLVTLARPMSTPLVLNGRVYCDNCRLGFETSKTTYIADARVEVVCKDRKNADILYTQQATTDSTGTYKIPVFEDHDDQVCDVKLVSSPMPECKIPSAGRDTARVILTTANGIASNLRYANAMGFMRDEALSGCAEVVKQYQEFDN